MSATDYLIAGGTGQLGRTVLRGLSGQGHLTVLMRRDSMGQARDELRAIVGGELTDVSVLLGDIASAQLPVARHVVHAAGRSTFASSYGDCFVDNTLTTVALAQHAKTTGGHLHLFSSFIVAMHRDSPLTESDPALPLAQHHGYSMSKCLAELAAERILDSGGLTIYRMAGVAPEPAFLDRDTRADHWLTLLLGTGALRRPPTTDGMFFLIRGDKLGAMMADLMPQRQGGRVHVIGGKYSLAEIYAAGLPETEQVLPRLGERMLRSVNANFPTLDVVSRRPLLTDRLDAAYWREFACAAAQSLRRAMSTAPANRPGWTMPAWGFRTVQT